MCPNDGPVSRQRACVFSLDSGYLSRIVLDSFLLARIDRGLMKGTDTIIDRRAATGGGSAVNFKCQF